MVTCANCGNEAREGAQFCGSCGAPIVPAAPEPSRVEPPPPPSQGGQHRLRWFAVGALIALLVAGGAAAAVLSLTGGDGSTEVTAASDEQTVTSEEDCLALASVVADFTVGANADDLIPIALDITASDYLVDRDFLDSYSDRAPEEIRADVVRLALWIDRYATAMQAAGLQPGSLPTTPDQAGEIRAASQIGSVEQDQLPGSIESLGVWAGNGCSGGRPPTDPTFDPLTFPTTEAGTPEPAPGELSDEAVTALINEAMSQRTELEFGVLGSAPLGAEVRDCHKDVSESSLLETGETQWILYACEVWYEGELWSEDALLQSVDSDGNLYRAP